MIIDIALSAGWTLDHVETCMTMSQARALFAYWRKHPPLHKLAAAFMGHKPSANKEKPAINPNDPSGIGRLIQQFPNGFVRQDG